MGTRHVVPKYVDDANTGISKGGKSVWEEVEMVGSAARAFIDNLVLVSLNFAEQGLSILTMAVIDFPPWLTLTQPPQFALFAQLELDKAVPINPLGKV